MHEVCIDGCACGERIGRAGADLPCADARVCRTQRLVLDGIGRGRVGGNVARRKRLDAPMLPARVHKLCGECRSGHVDSPRMQDDAVASVYGDALDDGDRCVLRSHLRL
ncbi:hypothetical protein [Caballeronia sp. LZ003]|uniref:hypothetical protein n=1 Tax=unclassified Caballeronia TaxID=2646786 RepID=UPI003857AD93